MPFLTPQRVAVSLFIPFLLIATGSVRAQDMEVRRSIAVTIDDLPTVGAYTLEDKQGITSDLVAALVRNGIPAVGFVNESKLGPDGPVPEQVALLEQWLDAGLELGNHTYSHPSLFDTPLDRFMEDVLRGETVTRPLMAKHGQRLRYFRHPFLHTGSSMEKKVGFESFLAELGYETAPVTIANDDYIYALAYRKAEGDADLMQRIGADYLRYMDSVFAFFERFSVDVLEREPAQVLLLHANRLNADYLDQLAALMKRRGYRFISLEKALQDPAYTSPDTFIDRKGISWLIRWAATQGRPLQYEPDVARWVEQSAYPERF